MAKKKTIILSPDSGDLVDEPIGLIPEANGDMEQPIDAETLLGWVRLSRDLKKAAAGLTAPQARYLVDTYYQIQTFRISAAHEARHAGESEEPKEFLDWIGGALKRLEGSIKSALDIYSSEQVPGRWAKSIVGIGPVLAAGLLAHIDVNPWKCVQGPFSRVKRPCRKSAPHDGCGFRPIRTAGGVWRFAGLDPTQEWATGQKRPWNAALKVLCWKIGESFVKVKGHENDIYGKLYDVRKGIETPRNADGAFADQAARILSAKKFRRDTIAKAAYETGKLPPGHIHARAKRWVVKLFLAHFHHVAYEVHFGEAPPKPYVISVLGHADYLAPPNWPMTTEP